jgi:hypothetical protein
MVKNEMLGTIGDWIIERNEFVDEDGEDQGWNFVATLVTDKPNASHEAAMGSLELKEALECEVEGRQHTHATATKFVLEVIITSENELNINSYEELPKPKPTSLPGVFLPNRRHSPLASAPVEIIKKLIEIKESRD